MDYRRTAVGQKAVSLSGAKLWNSIPMNIRNLNIIVIFKRHLYTERIAGINFQELCAFLANIRINAVYNIYVNIIIIWIFC